MPRRSEIASSNALHARRAKLCSSSRTSGVNPWLVASHRYDHAGDPSERPRNETLRALRQLAGSTAIRPAREQSTPNSLLAGVDPISHWTERPLFQGLCCPSITRRSHASAIYSFVSVHTPQRDGLDGEFCVFNSLVRAVCTVCTLICSPSPSYPFFFVPTPECNRIH
jgi:hypothetical protein